MEGEGLELRSAPDKSMLRQGGWWKLDGAGGRPAGWGGGGKNCVRRGAQPHPAPTAPPVIFQTDRQAANLKQKLTI